MGGRGLRWLLRIMSAAVHRCSSMCRLWSSCSERVQRRIRSSRGRRQLFTTSWFSTAWHNPNLRQPFVNSFLVGILATLIALTLGTLASFAMARAQVLRARHDLVRTGPADRVPGDRHRAGAVVDGRRDARTQLRHPGDHHRPRDVLRRRRLQQRRGAPAADLGFDHRGVDGPRRRRDHDVPLRDVPRDPNGPAGRRVARLRAVVRRDHRDVLPGGHHADAAALDLQRTSRDRSINPRSSRSRPWCC